MISLLSTHEYRNYPNRFYDAAVDSVLHLQTHHAGSLASRQLHLPD